MRRFLPVRLALLSVLSVYLWPLAGSAAPRREDLPVPGHTAAVVSVPGGGGPKPVLVATHGSFDRPEWQCETYGELAGDAAFVLCPRGTLRWDSPTAPDERRYYYRGAAALEREVLAALGALRARYPGRIKDGPAVYAGFSQGAILGLPILQKHGRRFPRALLVEGGHRWGQGSARAYRAAGASRVVLACGQGGCVSRAAGVAALLQGAGLEVRLVQGLGAGHTYDGPVAAAVGPALPWLLDGL